MQQKVTIPFSHRALCTVTLFLAACTKYADFSPSELTLSDKIKVLEDSGTIPKLDRSSDIKGPDQNLNGVRDDIDAWNSLVALIDKITA